MKMPEGMSISLVAPCGMNCGLCYTYLRKKKPCLGCRGVDETKPGHCRKCKIKDCAVAQGIEHCFQCSSFPCVLIKRLDKSYRQRYAVSLVENALRLKDIGAEQFMLAEKQKWSCTICAGVIGLHDKICSECGHAPQNPAPPLA